MAGTQSICSWQKAWPGGMAISSLYIAIMALAPIAVAGEAGMHPCLAATESAPSPVRVFRQADSDLFADQAGQLYRLTDVFLEAAWSPGPDEEAAEAFAHPSGTANRWGIIPAWITQKDGNRQVLLQERWMRAGQALAAPETGNLSCLARLKTAEQSARRAGLGRWGSAGTHDSRRPVSLEKAAGQYVIVEGRVVSLGKTRRTRYLNFGRYWKRDLTVTIKTADEAAFDQVLTGWGLTVADLEGVAVRVRGYVGVKDGPHMVLEHPGQLDVIEGTKGRQ